MEQVKTDNPKEMETVGTKIEKPNTTVRNSNLFCLNCGNEQVIQYPIHPEMFAAMTEAFNKIHAKCPKTWEEGKADQRMTEAQKAQWWMSNGERGISSETIWGRMMGFRIVKYGESHPHDPDDFSRCYKLLQAVPEWREKLQSVMKPVSPQWSILVDNWDKLTEMYEQNVREQWKNYKKVGMYDFMQTLFEKCKS